MLVKSINPTGSSEGWRHTVARKNDRTETKDRTWQKEARSVVRDPDTNLVFHHFKAAWAGKLLCWFTDCRDRTGGGRVGVAVYETV